MAAQSKTRACDELVCVLHACMLVCSMLVCSMLLYSTVGGVCVQSMYASVYAHGAACVRRA